MRNKPKENENMSKNNRSETIVIKNPSEKIIRLVKEIQTEKTKRREEILKKKEYNFTINM